MIIGVMCGIAVYRQSDPPNIFLLNPRAKEYGFTTENTEEITEVTEETRGELLRVLRPTLRGPPW
jgi:hypothetical protein